MIFLDELLSRVERVTKLGVLQNETSKIITKDKNILNHKRGELKSGKNADGSIIGTYKSERYELFKRQLNPLANGKVDLILTGSTKDKLEVLYLGNGTYKIVSTDKKWNSLIGKYGEKIQIINQKEFERLQTTVYAPLLIQSIKRIANL